MDTSGAATQMQENAMSLLSLLVKGGPVMIPLAGLFLVLTLLVMIYFLTIRRGALITDRFLALAEAMLKKRDFLGLVAACSKHGEASARVLGRVIDFGEENPDSAPEQIREIAQSEGTRHVSLLNQRVSYLADVATLAPMLGLLGTVIGIINSFGVLSSEAQNTSSILLASGVAQALVTTGAGLVIGISAAFFYAFFRGKVQKIASDFETGVAYMIALYSQHRRPAQRAASGRLGDDFA